MRPMLFDWQEDSNEHNDVGSYPAYGEVFARMHDYNNTDHDVTRLFWVIPTDKVVE
ncbi:MAG: hypothetical protein ACI8UP_004966 [Porticoccaceae bacterium]